MKPSPARTVRLTLESLEARELLATTNWILDSFDGLRPGTEPVSWSSWENGPTGVFRGVAGAGFSGTTGLVSNGDSNDIARAWKATAQPATVQVRAAVRLNSNIPALVFARGQNLTGLQPDYYAVSVTTGMEAKLLRVIDGRAVVLGTVRSSTWVNGPWVQVTLAAEGSRLQAFIYRTDTGQYLNAGGAWQTAQTAAIVRLDPALTAGGMVGVGRGAGIAGSLAIDKFQVAAGTSTTTPTTPTTPTPAPSTGTDVFDRSAAGTIPSGWSRWTSTSTGAFHVAARVGVGASNALISDGLTTTTARAWNATPAAATAEVKAAVYLNTLAPAQLFLRGSNLSGSSPTYYAASVSRGLRLELQRVIAGRSTTLATVISANWLTDKWVRMALRAQGDRLQVFLMRIDTGQYLAPDRSWKSTAVAAIDVRNSSITAGGYAGVNRPASYAGRVTVDQFSLTGVTATPTQPAPAPSPVPAPTPAPIPSAGLPRVPRHYSHIRIAQLAYIGTPFGSFEQTLLRNSVDLVVPNTALLSQLDSLAPATPKLIYSNVSNLYENLLTDWLVFAAQKGYDRERASFHVNAATPFAGNSGSSRPVNSFWSVRRGSDALGWADLTRPGSATSITIEFATSGRSVVIGYPERFREINITLSRAAGTGWSAVLEYPTAVDSLGRPTAWATLRVIRNTTNGLRNSGQITFDPPANWKPATIDGSDRLYYMRFRTVGSGTAPIASNVLGRDYVKASGRTTGTIPAFDTAADLDRDGYLKDSEYARRRPGFEARFAYESRLFYPAYGQMRFATNPSDSAFRAWAIDYHYRYLNTQPRADGLFMDNSFGRLQVDAAHLRESMSRYSEDYATLLAAIETRIAPRWILANTAGGGLSADSIARNGVSFLEEFALRPMAHNYTQFEDLANLVRRRLTQAAGKAYTILDSYPQGSSPSDPRMQIGTLAAYYLLADPNATMLMFNGGFEPNSTWARHWSEAVKFNVGQARGTWSVLATGLDPANRALTYKIYQRQYDNALVLFKPLSYTTTRGSGTTADATRTTHVLNAMYRPLQANGTLGAATNRITLRNGEGAILGRMDNNWAN